VANDERNFVCVNADKTAEVPCDSPDAAYRFRADDAEYKKMMRQNAKATEQDAAPAEDAENTEDIDAKAVDSAHVENKAVERKHTKARG
jgi:hypothetical protein